MQIKPNGKPKSRKGKAERPEEKDHGKSGKNQKAFQDKIQCIVRKGSKRGKVFKNGNEEKTIQKDDFQMKVKVK